MALTNAGARARLLSTTMATLAALLLSPVVAKGDPSVHAYALVIGSNRGGDGQDELAFAVRDAERVSELLQELGRTPAAQLERLSDPTAHDIELALARLGDRLRVHAAAGERSQLTFYYSGHARANALSLGKEELPLARLRGQLMALPSTLTVVVLDACQSGAFSGVKGARPAADFSAQSVHDLHNTGIAVLASSTGSEFSQESRELGSSYFTHHLLVSLRGAGDLDRNGRVSLDEAYAYAYQHTLSDTARTQTGSQHATLETALTGRGDVPLSYPVDADAQLALSGSIEGKVLVQQAGGGAIMAELVKAPGAPLLIALPSGRFEVLLRGETSARSCDVTLTRGAVYSLDPAQCKLVPLPAQRSKADDPHGIAERNAMESWFLELGLGVLRPFDDAYTRRLRQFDMHDTQPVDYGFDGAAGWMLNRYFGLLARYGMIEHQQFYRYRINEGGDGMAWVTRAITLGPRARLPLLGRWLVLFGDAGVGVGFTRGRFGYSEVSGTRSHSAHAYERARGFALRAAAGLDVALSHHVGLYAAGSYAWAPTLENDLGETRQNVGFSFLSGLRINGVLGGW